MTHLLYYDDAYLRSFDATVEAVETTASGARAALNQTAFYPGGGGQPHDLGTLAVGGAHVDVVGMKKEGDCIWHLLAQPLECSRGDAVQGALDWERRYRLMRTHTAMHILCGVVWRDYGAQVTGGNMDPGEGRMDFEFAAMSRELIDKIEAACNVEVQVARDTRTQMLPRAQAFQIPDLIRTKINLLPPDIAAVRTFEIIGLDLQADGGTHVHNTREVGPIRIVDYKSKGAINKRIYLRLTA
jgi:misacylated tRNA(Ala) deacylase